MFTLFQILVMSTFGWGVNPDINTNVNTDNTLEFDSQWNKDGNSNDEGGGK